MKPLSRSELRALRALTHRSVRERRGAFLLEGARSLSTALDSSADIKLIAATQNAAEHREVSIQLDHAADNNIAVRLIKRRELEEITDTETPSGVVALIKWQPLREHTADLLLEKIRELKINSILCLDAINDPGNAGSLVRAADAFGIAGVLFGNGSVEVTNQKVVRSAVGSLFHLRLVAERVTLKHVLQKLQMEGWRIFRAETGGGTPPVMEPPAEPWALLLGNEAHGVSSQNRCIGEAVHIPMRNSAESLNVAVAGGILIYTLTTRRTSDE